MSSKNIFPKKCLKSEFRGVQEEVSFAKRNIFSWKRATPTLGTINETNMLFVTAINPGEPIRSKYEFFFTLIFLRWSWNFFTLKMLTLKIKLIYFSLVRTTVQNLTLLLSLCLLLGHWKMEARNKRKRQTYYEQKFQK